MKYTSTLLLTFIFSVITSQNSTLSGYIKDANSGEALIGATIFVEEEGKGASTNVYGFYSISLNSGNHTVKYSYVGYEEVIKIIDFKEHTRVNIELSESQDLLEEVIVEARQTDENTTGTQMGKIDLSMDKIKTIPAFMGEVDVLKTIQFLPGVSSGGEGNTGFYVRGGGPDQNLILLDGAPIYNTSHLLGFFSTFNEQAVSDIEIIKGGFPAEYGGRLSSILDIKVKEGNMKEWKVNGGLGIISGSLSN